MPVGHQHADEDEEHEEALDGQDAGPEEPGLLHPAGGAVLAALTARPAWEADGHVRVTRTAAVTPVRGAAICTAAYTHTHTRGSKLQSTEEPAYNSNVEIRVYIEITKSQCHVL